MHHLLYLGQLVHQANFVMQAACCVDKHHVRPLRFSRIYGVVCHTGGVAAHLLFDNGHAYAFAPNDQLLNCGCAECVGSTEHHFQSGFLKLVSQFANGSSFAHTIYPHHHNDVGFAVGCNVKAFSVVIAALSEQRTDFVFQYAVQLGRVGIFVTCHALLYTVNDVDGSVRTNV